MLPLTGTVQIFAAANGTAEANRPNRRENGSVPFALLRPRNDHRCEKKAVPSVATKYLPLRTTLFLMHRNPLKEWYTGGYSAVARLFVGVTNLVVCLKTDQVIVEFGGGRRQG